MEYPVLFKTRHGSHLYGLNHADSDEDFYTVVSRPRGARYKWSKQTIVDGEDSLRVDLPTWLRLCEKGVPQALEAMFAPEPLVDKLGPLRAGFRAGGEARRTYARTITNFVEAGDIKRKRHALRLAFNLRDLLRSGRFNPRLTELQKSQIFLTVDALGDDPEMFLDVCFRTAYAMEPKRDRRMDEWLSYVQQTLLRGESKP